MRSVRSCTFGLEVTREQGWASLASGSLCDGRLYWQIARLGSPWDREWPTTPPFTEHRIIELQRSCYYYAREPLPRFIWCKCLPPVRRGCRLLVSELGEPTPGAQPIREFPRSDVLTFILPARKSFTTPNPPYPMNEVQVPGRTPLLTHADPLREVSWLRKDRRSPELPPFHNGCRRSPPASLFVLFLTPHLILEVLQVVDS